MRQNEFWAALLRMLTKWTIDITKIRTRQENPACDSGNDMSEMRTLTWPTWVLETYGAISLMRSWAKAVRAVLFAEVGHRYAMKKWKSRSPAAHAAWHCKHCECLKQWPRQQCCLQSFFSEHRGKQTPHIWLCHLGKHLCELDVQMLTQCAMYWCGVKQIGTVSNVQCIGVVLSQMGLSVMSHSNKCCCVMMMITSVWEFYANIPPKGVNDKVGLTAFSETVLPLWWPTTCTQMTGHISDCAEHTDGKSVGSPVVG